jgi:hypothetical protein
MRVGRRRVAVVAAVLVAVAAGTGVARAYYLPGEVAFTGSPGNYFTFCADRQLDTAGITPADLDGSSNGGHNYTVQNFVHDAAGVTAGQALPSDSPFVLGKSGIGYAPYPESDPPAYDRRILTTQLVESDTFDGESVAVQVRCKMRSRESINRPETEKQKYTSGSASPVPWGFGPGTATGIPRSCLAIQAEIAAAVWDGLDETQQNAAVYRWAVAPDGDLANVDMAVEVLPEGLSAADPLGTVTSETNAFIAGFQWTGAFSSVRAKGDRLEIRSAKLEALSTANSLGLGDKILGAYYCTFSTPEYLRSVFLGEIAPPVAEP